MSEKEVKKKKIKIKKKKTITKTKEEESFEKSHIPFRLNFLFFVVFALFVALIIQLSYLQIINGSFFEAKIEWSHKNIVQGNAPRGMIYDAKGEVLVSNQANQAIIFTKKTGMKTEEILEISQKLNELITIKEEKLSERDKKDFWLADKAHLEAAQNRLTDGEKKGKTNGEVYAQTVDKVTPEEIQFNETELKEATIFKKINGAYALTPVFIKNKDVSPEEIAIIGENIVELPGISTGMDWEREYPKGDFLRSILGTVSSEKTGLPEEKIDEYLAKGYARNDRVGLSYLEETYESVLKGTKSQSEIIINRNEEIESQKQVYEGEKGKNLVLTIDSNFQQEVTDILRTNYQYLINSGKAQFSDGAYVVVVNPKTGEVLALVGLARNEETGELEDDTLGTITKAFVPGSSIKGATVMAGYENGVIHGNQTMVDEPIQIASSNRKISLFNPVGSVPVNTTTALALSSNVYMMKIVFGMMNVDYKYGMILPDRTDVFETLRKTYQDFGLGTFTGIDLPNESAGISPKDYYDSKGNLIDGRMGNLLDLSYGNYDTYTPIQLAQYISTIANDGKRVAPHVVKGIYNNNAQGGLGELETIIQPKIMSEIGGTKGELALVQQGLYEVVNGSDYRRTGMGLQGASLVTSAKTGTAETFVPGSETPVINSTMVAYAPSDNPEVAVSLVLPHLKDDEDHTNAIVTRQIIDAYAAYKK